jgi:peptide/nickel transport system permease protein
MTVHRSSLSSSSVGRAVARTLVLYVGVLSLTFVLLRLAPGDPATFLVAPGASASDAARLRTALGLDAPVAVQYARWLTAMLRLDLGDSFVDRQPVITLLARALPVSLGLGAASLALSFAIGIAVGIVQAARRASRTDFVLTMVSVGAPLWLRLPAIGMATPGIELHGAARLADLARHAILPVGLLAAIGAAGVARYVRTSALDLLASDWLRTARAKGLPERVVLMRHLGANLRAPVITLFALALPGTVAGSVFIETIFGWPGMGRLMVTAIVARDYPVVLGAAAAYAAIVILANLAAELLLPWADARVAA